MRKKNKAKGFTLPDFKTYYKVTVTKTMILASRQTCRTMERTESPEITLVYMVKQSSTRVSRLYNGDTIVLIETNGAGETGISICKRMKLDPYLSPYTKINQNELKT